MANLVVKEVGWDNPGHASAPRHDRVGDQTHQPDRTTAVDKFNVAFNKKFAQLGCCIGDLWVRSWGRSAEYAHSLKLVHRATLLRCACRLVSGFGSSRGR